VTVTWTGADLDALLSALKERGLDAEIADEEGEPVIEIPCAESDADRVVAEVETVLGELTLPLVPQKGDGKVFVRPPAA